MIVVTNDRELSIRCRNCGAKTQTIDAFIAFLAKKGTKARAFTTTPSFKDSPHQISRLLLIFEKKMLEKIKDDIESL